MTYFSSHGFIDYMLLHNTPSEVQVQYSFLVHSSIYPMIQEYLTRSGIRIMQELGSYELILRKHTFDMKILVLGSQSGSLMDFDVFTNLIKRSQLTYFWDEKTTLFQEVGTYHLLEEFIVSSDLNRHVISVEEISGVNSLGRPIKIVTFDSTIQQDQLLNGFEQFLCDIPYRKQVNRRINHYYFTNAFPWHQPEIFHIYTIPFRNQRIFFELQTFLTCMRELSYTKDPHIDLISLCSLKLAFCDDRNLTEASSDLGYEIDSLIARFLRRMQQNQSYIKHGHFDLNRYAVNTNSSFNNSFPAIMNLVYTYEKIFFRNITIPVIRMSGNIVNFEFTNTLNLIDENKSLNILRSNSNIRFQVDAEFYENMNSKLFCELLKCNVYEMRLNTYYKWKNEPYLIDFGGNDNSKFVIIELVGTNQFNFIEDFIQFLKTFPTFLTSKMTIIINGVMLKSYHIFKNLEIEQLKFVAPMITFAMLTDLSDGLVKILEIDFGRGKIEDRTCTWSALINGFNRKSVKVEIAEEENTWQHLFESIAIHLIKFKLNEFKFDCDLKIECQNHHTISISFLKFMFDELNTRLEIRHLDGEKIDLYWYKNIDVCGETNDDYKNFEFYQ